MIRSLLMVSVAVLFIASPVSSAEDHTRKKSHAAAKKAKVQTGASCKAPAVATCAACSITCRPGEAATCAGGQVTGDLCTTQPLCRCK